MNHLLRMPFILVVYLFQRLHFFKKRKTRGKKKVDLELTIKDALEHVPTESLMGIHEGIHRERQKEI